MSEVTPTAGVIGTGRMGAAMASRIAGAGFDLMVWNRHRTKAETVAASTGAMVADSPAAVAAKTDVLITSLADDEAVFSVYTGDDGVVAGIGPGTVAVDTSTVDPETIRSVGTAVDETGAGFIDCPVSGSVATVEAGALTIMAGGDRDLIDRVRPVLEPISARIIHVGDRGAGAATKLAVNGLVHGLNVALAEALVLAEKAGVDRSTAYEVFVSGAGGAPFVQYKRAAYENPDDAAVAFSLDLVQKDLELITGLGERLGVPMRQAETVLDIVRGAIDAGMGDRDMSAIAIHLRGEG
ncbi:MAG TPA: NAD(P)-dependent oxidoreductase [Acidimicrobiia bacterium]|nr:NAD(P)-dependent oxidoreductase [Acidimicrobiia bacterium]